MPDTTETNFTSPSGGQRVILDETLRIVSQAIGQAEANVRQELGSCQGDFDEEAITSSFRTKLNLELQRVSANMKIARAFATDLAHTLSTCRPRLTYNKARVQCVTAGFLAAASWHPRSVEGRKRIAGQKQGGSGGDFGLTIAQPTIRLHTRRLVIDPTEHRTGLLVQAKRRDRSRKWGILSPHQQDVLQHHTEYLALLLYDHVNNSQLLPFRWPLCKGHTVPEIVQWLTKDAFPDQNVLTSVDIVNNLGKGAIGTHNDANIDDVILAEHRNAIAITLYWKDDHFKSALASLNDSMKRLSIKAKQPLAQKRVLLSPR
jgi:hypothetical protein